MTPESLAKSGTEQGHQSALFAWAALEVAAGRYPQLALMFAIPNGDQRGDGTKRGAMIAGSRLKATGLKAGVWDIFLPVPKGRFHGMFIEMKKPGESIKAGSNQERFGLHMWMNGYHTVVCDNWIKARDSILDYLDDKLAS